MSTPSVQKSIEKDLKHEDNLLKVDQKDINRNINEEKNLRAKSAANIEIHRKAITEIETQRDGQLADIGQKRQDLRDTVYLRKKRIIRLKDDLTAHQRDKARLEAARKEN